MQSASKHSEACQRARSNRLQEGIDTSVMRGLATAIFNQVDSDVSPRLRHFGEQSRRTAINHSNNKEIKHNVTVKWKMVAAHVSTVSEKALW